MKNRRFVIALGAAVFIIMIIIGYFRAASVQAIVAEAAAIEKSDETAVPGTSPCTGNCLGCAGCPAGITASPEQDAATTTFLTEVQEGIR